MTTIEEFLVLDRTIKTAHTLQSTSGTCSLPPPHKGKCLSIDAIEKVKHFYENNENTQIMSQIKRSCQSEKNHMSKDSFYSVF